MPLIHSKKPAAFKQNIRTEMHAGKPQKQAVAIAYSEKREAEKRDRKHSYSKGGECHACGGGACKMAEGGSVLSKHEHAEGQKGVHKSAEYMPIRGSETNRTNKMHQGASEARYGGKASERGAHEQVLGQITAMKGKDRTNLAEGGEVGHAEPDGDEGDMELSHGLGKELMDAFESKNHKAVMSALEACVLHCMSSRDGEED